MRQWRIYGLLTMMVVLFWGLFVHVYNSSPGGMVLPSAAKEFYANPPVCEGWHFKYPGTPPPDAPTKEICVGWVLTSHN